MNIENCDDKEELLKNYIGPQLFGAVVDAAFRCAYQEAKYLCVPYDGEYFNQLNREYRNSVIDELIDFIDNTSLRYNTLQRVVEDMIPDDDAIRTRVIAKYEEEPYDSEADISGDE